MDDPDSPRGTRNHWVLFDLPAGLRALPEGQPNTARLLNGAGQGLNSWGDFGYRGPCPDPGAPHTYRVFIYAVDRPLMLAPGIIKPDLLAALRGRILAESMLTGTYQRMASGGEENGDDGDDGPEGGGD